jgi:hypothetical protein
MDAEAEPLFTERWHYQIPPYKRGHFFTWHRQSTTGRPEQPRVSCNDWEGKVPLSKYGIQMQWWYLSPGQRVFSLTMGRRPDMQDDQLYSVHPSRYTVGTFDWRQGEHPYRDHLFDWEISLDGINFTLSGGEYKKGSQGWHVYCEESPPLILYGTGENPATTFHPDFPVWGPNEDWLPPEVTRRAPTHWFIPPVDCPGALVCDGALREGLMCSHEQRQHAPVELDMSREMKRGSRTQACVSWAGEEGTTWARGRASHLGLLLRVTEPYHGGAAQARH